MWKLQQNITSVWFHILIVSDFQKKKKRNYPVLLLSASMELFDGTELIKELLIDQPGNKQKFVV